ncbi:PBSX family phage terminase large subunit [Pediococcus acidilactici]|uniref:PBSX family phage terminase large subunit n=2 Tax=Pediococcus acidilactici TaxID=1254 RepID=A0AAW8YRJ2_PEDAC|nr:PBSX family phage terminase large subunit [Pediococcus acidilactici]MDC8307896.1 PBSX family phage terminase large subunit [Lacticaseibacillus rhamnosus]MDV2602156.1 PBSX family phage terminase large subunit [Pediococcus acidilactici]MDV2843581.1 PBSX family phage terminase large subunit [Pediococcus acidilactici]MDV2912196.1 PBSX family phage terminase large subunit [Pediococcus acidilactici]WQS18328.1 PBSX family phage terminase large subunit [Pediococcus acidilactici]
MNKVIKLSDLIQPHFYKFFNSNKNYFILKGGRNSFKSSTISLKLVMMMKQQIQRNHKANIVCVRENAVNLRDSVFNQIKWAIDMLGMTSEFRSSVSPMKIEHIRTGSTFRFYGADNPEKLKSNTISNVIALWYEEISNFKSGEVFDQSNSTFVRQKSPFVDAVKIFYSFNPPKSKYNWVNQWAEAMAGDQDYFIDTSDYTMDRLGIIQPEQLRMIEKYKRNDYNYYSWLYLGKSIGIGNNVYNMKLFHKLQEIPTDDEIKSLAVGLDAGHINSATTAVVIGLTSKGKVIVLDTYYYSPHNKANKKAPSDLVPEIKSFLDTVQKRYGNKRYIKLTIDSAEGAMRNEFVKEFNLRWHGVVKKKEAEMIDFVSNLLAQGRVYYLDNEDNKIFIDQHERYSWDDKTFELDEPKVIKEDDHTCDAFKYIIMDLASKLGLKQGNKAAVLRNDYI